VRGWGTWLLVVALAGLGLVATVDALVGEGDSPRRAARSATTVPLLAEQPELAVSQLRQAAVEGVLTYSDEECRLHAVSLPELEPRRAPRIQICEPLTGSAGLGVVKGEVVWAGLGMGVIQVVLSREDLTSELVRARPGVRLESGYRAEQAVSLSGGRIAVVAAAVDAPWERVVVLFRAGRFERVAAGLLGEHDIVRTSPGGRFFAVLQPGHDGLRVFTADGDFRPLPPVTQPHAVAWSPDDRWTALATAHSVYVYPTERPEELVVRIPLPVRDLDWSE
jgi:hypothetical protein